MAEYSATRRTPRKHKRVVMKALSSLTLTVSNSSPETCRPTNKRQSDDDKRILGELPPHWAVFNERE